MMGTHPVFTTEPMWVSLLYGDETKATMLLSGVIQFEDGRWDFDDAHFGMQLEGFTFDHVLVSDADGNAVHTRYLGEWVVEPGYSLDVRWPPRGVLDLRTKEKRIG